MKLLLLIVTFVISVVFAHFDSSSSSESCEGSHEHGHGNHGGHGHGRPPRPPARRPCQSGWTAFDRPQGRWCVKAFYGNNKHDGAEAACQAQGAKLSGFQTADESMRATHLLRAVINQASPGANTVAWVGGIRKASCPTVQSCTPANSYQWTDGHTTGTDGFTFGVNQPDILGGVQFCLTQNVHAQVDSGLTSAQWHFFNGNLDDVECYATLNTYLCGKVPN